jgi:putative chitinase
MDISKLKDKIPLKVYDDLDSCIKRFGGPKNNVMLAHFLCQVAHESANFTAIRENLNYSTDGLMKTFKKYFKDRIEAATFARKPEIIANRVYASRMGNGNETSGDGWRYRGRGYLQLTGRTNYAIFGTYVDENLLENPDLVATKYAMHSAFWFFERNNLWKLTDSKNYYETLTTVTKRINGGTHGLSDRASKFRTFSKFLGI